LAVCAATDAYLATLGPDRLDQVLDLSALGMGQVTLAWVFSRLLALVVLLSFVRLSPRRDSKPTVTAVVAGASHTCALTSIGGV